MKKIIVISLLPAIIFLTGCEIEKLPATSSTPEGSIYITSHDASDSLINDADILIDGITRSEKTPSYIHGIDEGLHIVLIRKFGYYDNDNSITVIADDTVEVNSLLVKVPETGLLLVDSEPPGARLLINEKRYLLPDRSEVLTPAEVELPWGNYSISVYKEGYLTTSPLLPQLVLIEPDTVDFTFSLEAVEAGIRPGFAPIPFTLKNLLGEETNLSDFMGHVVMINFWYTDCEPCRREFPGIENVYQRHAADGFRVLAINRMLRDNVERVREFVEEVGLSFEILLDEDIRVTWHQYQISEFPMNFIIDRTGKIHSFHGSVEEEQLEEILTELL